MKNDNGMNKQKSFSEQKSALYLVPTPIGNLSEMSPRAIETLKAVDWIACEDTRNSGKLLKHFEISKPLLSHHEHNQDVSIPKILDRLEAGESVAVISDAGYPLVSDPGQKLVRTCVEHDIAVIPVSGPNAALDALVASGLDARHYLFYGFLDAKTTKRVKQLEALRDFPYTIVFYEAPHRIQAMLDDLYAVFGNRAMCLGREITKLHEEFLRGRVDEIRQSCDGLKGEMVVVVEGAPKQDTSVSMDEALDVVARYQSEGMTTKKAIQQTAKDLNLSKNELYQRVMRAKKEEE